MIIACGERRYVKCAISHREWIQPATKCWDNKFAGAQPLFAKVIHFFILLFVKKNYFGLWHRQVFSAEEYTTGKAIGL